MLQKVYLFANGQFISAHYYKFLFLFFFHSTFFLLRYPNHEWETQPTDQMRGGKSQTILLQLTKQVLNLREDEVLFNFPHDALGPGMHLDICTREIFAHFLRAVLQFRITFTFHRNI